MGILVIRNVFIDVVLVWGCFGSLCCLFWGIDFKVVVVM